MANNTAQLDFIRHELLPRHAARVPEERRGGFTGMATNMVETGIIQVNELHKKTKTGLYNNPDAHAYLVAELRNETVSMLDVIEGSFARGVHEGLDNFRKAERTIPGIDPAAARELRAILRGLTKEQREHTLMSTTDPDVAAAVLNAPGGGLGLEVSDNVTQQVRRAYNERHRAPLMQQIADAEATLAAIEEFRRTLSTTLMDVLK